MSERKRNRQTDKHTDRQTERAKKKERRRDREKERDRDWVCIWGEREEAFLSVGRFLGYTTLRQSLLLKRCPNHR